MHGGIPDEHRYHLTVALFDDKNGQRITDANILVRVTSSKESSDWIALQPMLIGEMKTYGNYFRMPAAKKYQIHLEISRPSESRKVNATFLRARP
jgi:hypothetical protein